jgi:IclR family transcriptional regulator, mhp operon transcriptional activator
MTTAATPRAQAMRATPLFDPIIALQRGLKVLEVINRGKSVSLKTIHEQTGLHKTTVIRMLDTLIDSGYVARTSRSTYVPTGRTLQLSQGYDLPSRVSDIAEPVMTEFRRTIGWPSDFALYSDDFMVVVQTSRERGPMYFRRETGHRAPMLTSALGPAYLAFCNSADRLMIADRLIAAGDPRNRLAHDRPALEARLSEVRARGYATMDPSYSEEEYGGKVWGLAVPVRDEDHVYGAINVLLLRSASSEQDAITRFLRPLQEVATRLGRAIGDETPGRPLDESVLAQ